MGSGGANRNSPRGEMRRMFTGEFSGYHGYRREMFVMSWDSSCGQFDLTTSQHVITGQLASTCGQYMGQGFSLLYAVSSIYVVWACFFRKCYMYLITTVRISVPLSLIGISDLLRGWNINYTLIWRILNNGHNVARIAWSAYIKLTFGRVWM